MKILFTNFHPRNGGGHVTYVVNLLRGLVNHHQLTVATPASSRLYRLASEISGVRVVDMAFTTRPSSWWADRRILRELIVNEQFDTVHVNGSADHKQVMLALMGIRHRPRVIFTKHNDHSLSSFGHWLRARFS
ncbi:MAG: glycosyltransferase, partial [Alcaligenaceae bacterium]